MTERFDNSRPNDFADLPSGRRPIGRCGSWPLLAEAPVASLSTNPVSHFFQTLRPLPLATELAAVEDLPARACPRCNSPLPLDIDDREAFIVAVIGITRSGKTHFLASSLAAASKSNALEPLLCEEFAPDENSGHRFYRNYYTPLFREHAILAGTTEGVRYTPLAFRVAFQNRRPIILLMHDIDGETLADRYRRAKSAAFLRRADAVIFLIDPMEIDYFRRRLLFRTPHGYADSDQVQLLNDCISEMGRFRDPGEVPFAVTVSKSDLIIAVLGDSFKFARNGPVGEQRWREDVQEISDEVRSLLRNIGAHDILRAVGQLNTVSFHAVSALGAQPADDGLIDDIRPLRIIDPLATVLVNILGV